MYDSPTLRNGVRISPRGSEFGRAVVVLALVTAGLSMARAMPATAIGRHGFAALSKNHTPKQTQKQKQRNALLRAVKRNPRIATRKWFLRRAALLGADVPITIRLNPRLDQAGTPAGASDDTIKIAIDDPPADPALPAGASPGIVASTIDGGWAGTLRFSADTAGYGRVGVVELGFRYVFMTGSGFDLIHAADSTPCVGGRALLKTTPMVSINTGLRSQGYVDLFANTFEIALRTQFAFASDLRTDCTVNVFGTTSLMTGELRPPQPIRLSGTFRISPAITADGQVRLGRLAIKGIQSDSYVELHTCTDAPPAPPACPPDSKLTGRLVASTFTADLLIGALDPCPAVYCLP